MMFYVSRCHFRDATKRAEANQPPRKYITETLSASSIVNDTSRLENLDKSLIHLLAILERLLKHMIPLSLFFANALFCCGGRMTRSFLKLSSNIYML